MDRIKDISKVKLGLGYVLVKIHTKQSLILAPDMKEKGGPQVDYAEAVVVAPDIKDVTIGDIILDFRTTEGFKYKDEQYAMIPRQAIKVIVDINNFNNGIHRGKTKQRGN